MIVDKALRRIQKGQLVDLMLTGMYTANVQEVVESTIVDPKTNRSGENYVLVMLGLRLDVEKMPGAVPDKSVGICPNLYVVRDPPRQIVDQTKLSKAVLESRVRRWFRVKRNLNRNLNLI